MVNLVEITDCKLVIHLQIDIKGISSATCRLISFLVKWRAFEADQLAALLTNLFYAFKTIEGFLLLLRRQH